MTPADAPRTAPTSRIAPLDVVRGAALCGVLLMNLVTDFRAPLVRYLAQFHTTSDPIDRDVDLALGVAVESKALALYSLLFGMGAAMQWETRARPERSLLRRSAALLLFGVLHLTLIWNGDILTLYALCGLALIPCLRLGPRGLFAAGLVCLAVYASPWWFDGPSIPQGAALERVCDETLRAYTHGHWVEVLAFRARETRDLTGPLLVQVAPRTLGLALLGAAAWRGPLAGDRRHRTLRLARNVGLPLGAAAAIAAAVAATRGVSFGRWGRAVDAVSTVPLALGYGAALWLLAAREGWRERLAPVGAAGRMSLTHYLTQSVVFSAVFYGFGLYGRLGPAVVALAGLCVYALQCAVSVRWLAGHPIGPMEHLWRRLASDR